jgi:hypothetical protein
MLVKPLTSFKNESKPFVHIQRKNHQSISSPKLKIKLIEPRNRIAGNIVVTFLISLKS